MADTNSPHKKDMTVDDFVADLAAKDMTVADWARAKGFSLPVVYAVVRGNLIGRSGVSRRVVRAMGLQPPAMPFAAARRAKAAA